jgi:4-amino-4-deoxy-L-arabinose transferase-like glycosyltransferase
MSNAVAYAASMDAYKPAMTLPRTHKLGFVIITFGFFLKFALYGLFVTPLWDVPDEPGHYSYVENIAAGNLPLLGTTTMDVDVTKSWVGPKATPDLNWIAQHPPLYYAAAAPILLAAKACGLGFEAQVRSVRLTSALFGAFSILGILFLLLEFTREIRLALAGAIFFGCTPMFLHLSTGVSHDTLVACLAIWAIFWCIRWSRSDRFGDAILCSLFVGLGLITKFTGLGLALPLFFCMIYRLWSNERSETIQFLKRSATLWLIMFLPLCIWMARNVLLLDHFLPVTAIATAEQPKVAIGFFQYMSSQPFWQSTLISYIGLIGWNGRGNSQLDWIQVTGPSAKYFLTAILFCISLALFNALLGYRKHLSLGIALIAAFLVTIFIAVTMYEMAQARAVCIATFLTLLVTLIVNLPGAMKNNPTSWLLVTASLCTLFFCFIYYEHLWANYNGVMRATHGRYFYPVIPMLILIAAYSLRGYRLSGVALCAAITAMVYSDHYFLHHALRLYRQL